ncbi:MAG TPA: hypothetical protein DHW82_06860 [Spirochaetia bacterium]|nr:MAG: hypothetical protein A2Y41_05350 [Spirochaetes bacterium GWB1_36_13]HCL56715.1 hypothetical protein [Spirochaetia bacterium]
MKKIGVLTAVLFLMISAWVSGDEIELKNGSTLKGKITFISSEKDSLVIESGATGAISIKMEDIESIEFDDEKKGVESWYLEISAGAPYLDYAKDLKKADEMKFMSFSSAFYAYKTIGENMLLGGGFYSVFTPVKGRNLTGYATEQNEDTAIQYGGVEIVFKYFFNKITSGAFVNAAFGSSRVMILKGDLFDYKRQNKDGSLSSSQNNDHDNFLQSKIGLSGKLGLGYAIENNPDESAFLIGADGLFFYNKLDSQKWISYGGNVYFSILW